MAATTAALSAILNRNLLEFAPARG